jgi:hypothetical protein
MRIVKFMLVSVILLLVAGGDHASIAYHATHPVLADISEMVSILLFNLVLLWWSDHVASMTKSGKNWQPFVTDPSRSKDSP